MSSSIHINFYESEMVKKIEKHMKKRCTIAILVGQENIKINKW